MVTHKELEAVTVLLIGRLSRVMLARAPNYNAVDWLCRKQAILALLEIDEKEFDDYIDEQFDTTLLRVAAELSVMQHGVG